METKVIIKFVKYALLTLGVVLVIALLGGGYYKMEEFISSSTPFARAAALMALIAAGTLPSLICYSVSVAAFLAFRKIADKGIAAFGKTYTKNIYRAANKMEKVYRWGNN